jgi:hypothetical protein
LAQRGSAVNTLSSRPVTRNALPRSSAIDETPLSSILGEARRLVRLGFSVIPIRANGSKSPPTKWETYQHRLRTDQELTQWFDSSDYGLSIIAGKVSGNLEILDCDNAEVATEFVAMTNDVAPRLLNRCPQVRSPRPGLHVYYRCMTIEGRLISILTTTSRK